jgi:hypothetical protein
VYLYYKNRFIIMRVVSNEVLTDYIFALVVDAAYF